MICNINTPNTAAFIRTVASGERLTYKHYTMPMTRSAVVCHQPMRSLESHPSPFDWTHQRVISLALDPPFILQNWTETQPCYLLYYTSFPLQHFLLSSFKVRTHPPKNNKLLLERGTGYRMWLFLARQTCTVGRVRLVLDIGKSTAHKAIANTMFTEGSVRRASDEDVTSIYCSYRIPCCTSCL